MRFKNGKKIVSLVVVCLMMAMAGVVAFAATTNPNDPKNFSIYKGVVGIREKIDDELIPERYTFKLSGEKEYTISVTPRDNSKDTREREGINLEPGKYTISEGPTNSHIPGYIWDEEKNGKENPISLETKVHISGVCNADTGESRSYFLNICEDTEMELSDTDDVDFYPNDVFPDSISLHVSAVGEEAVLHKGDKYTFKADKEYTLKFVDENEFGKKDVEELNLASETGLDLNPNPSNEVEPDPNPNPGNEVEPDPNPNPGNEVEPDPNPNPGNEVEPDPNPNPGNEVEPDPNPNPGNEVEPDPNPNPGNEVEPDPNPNPGNEAEPDLNQTSSRIIDDVPMPMSDTPEEVTDTAFGCVLKYENEMDALCIPEVKNDGGYLADQNINCTTHLKYHNFYKSGSLTISKEVTNYTEEDLAGKKFSFILTLESTEGYDDIKIRTSYPCTDKINISEDEWSTCDKQIEIGKPFELEAGEAIKIVYLPIGAKCTVKELHPIKEDTDNSDNSEEGVEPEEDENWKIPKPIEQTITKDNRHVQAPFNNIYGKEPMALTISKKVESDNSNNLEKLFTFEITLKKADDTPLSGVFAYTKTNADAENENEEPTPNSVEFKDGVATITLKHNESAKITGLPEGTKYEVKEGPAEGLKSEATDDKGEISGENPNPVAKFVNRDEPDDEPTPQFGSLSISKVVTGSAGDKNKDFVFTVELTKENGTKLELSDCTLEDENGNSVAVLEGGTIQLKDGQTVKISNLPLGTTYKVTETPNDHTLTSITSTDTDAEKDMDKAEISGEITDELHDVEVKYTNTKSGGGGGNTPGGDDDKPKKDPPKKEEPPKEKPELPEPTPDTPERVTIEEDGIPKTFVKVWNPEEETYDYIPEEDIPLFGFEIPETGDSSQTVLLGGLCALSLAGVVILTATRRKKKDQ